MQFIYSWKTGNKASVHAFHYENMPIQIYENFTIQKKKKKKNNKKNPENFQMKNSGTRSFHISAQNIDCGYLLELPQRVSSNKYPQSMFLSRNKNINIYPCKPQFYCIKVGFKRIKTI